MKIFLSCFYLKTFNKIKIRIKFQQSEYKKLKIAYMNEEILGNL